MGKGLEIAADSKKSAGGIETILMVEDEEAFKVVSRRILELRGYTILEASDGPSAIKLCKNHAGTIHTTRETHLRVSVTSCRNHIRRKPW